MRAANKGRNLRPRASVPHGPPTSDAPPSLDVRSGEPVLQLVREEDDAPESARDSGGQGGSGTQPEVPAPVASFSAATQDVAPAATLRAEEIQKAARAEEAARVMRARADEVRKAEEADRIARAQETERATEAARAAREKAEHAARVGKAEEAARLAKAEESRKADEAARAVRARAEDARRVEEAAKAAKISAVETRKSEEAVKARKAEDTVRAARVNEDSRKTDVKKGAPAKAEDARPRNTAARPRDEDVAHEKPAARKTGASRATAGALEDEHDLSSISAEFFRRDEDSVPPVEEGEEAAAPMVLSPATLARRARLRRVVAGVVSFAAVISIAVVGKTVAAQKRTTSAPTPVTLEMKRELPVAPEPAKPTPVAEAPKAAPVAEAPKPEPAKADDKKAEEPAKVDDKKADDKKAEEPVQAAPSGADAVALRKETESLLNRGKRPEAIAKAREAIAADPTHAMPYLYLGSALQESGKWKDGVEAYCECVRNATTGPVNECRAMGGHK